jgi:nucleoid-associated protein YgaU
VPYGPGVEEGPKARRVLILLIAAEVAAVVTVHRLGSVDGFSIPRHDFVGWLQRTPSEEVLLAGVRLAALVAAWWLLGSTLLYVAARAARLHRTAAALGWATLPAVRRWVDRAAAVSIVAASALGAARPAGAEPPPTTGAAPPPVVVDLDHRDRSSLPDGPPPSVRTGRSGNTRPAPTVPPVSVPPASTVPSALPPRPSTPSPPPPAPPAERNHVINLGEHLWSIAAAHLGEVTAAEVAPYWRQLVEHNLARLRSRDPDLVYPGEVVELPPV